MTYNLRRTASSKKGISVRINSPICHLSCKWDFPFLITRAGPSVDILDTWLKPAPASRQVPGRRLVLTARANEGLDSVFLRKRHRRPSPSFNAARFRVRRTRVSGRRQESGLGGPRGISATLRLAPEPELKICSAEVHPAVARHSRERLMALFLPRSAVRYQAGCPHTFRLPVT